MQNILNSATTHITELEKIIGNTNITRYGLYKNGKFTIEKIYNPLIQDIIQISQTKKRILVQGLNTGFEALLCLLSNPFCIVNYSYNSNNNYTEKCAKYLEKIFPNRISNNIEKDYDFVLFLGRQFFTIEESISRNIDLFASYQKCVWGATLLMTDLHEWNLRRIWYIHVNEGRITDFILSFQYNILHGLAIYEPQNREYISKHKKYKIAICSIAHGKEFRKITYYGQKTIKDYCKKYDYDFRNDYEISERPPTWWKITLLLKCLKEDYDWIVWLDSDLFIMNPEISIETLIERYSDKKDIIVGLENELNSGFNCGVIFIKNTDWCRSFLQTVYNDNNHNNPSQEQGIMNEFYNINWQKAQEHINLLPWYVRHNINAFPNDFCSGDFVLHLLASRELPNLERMMDSYCPIKMDHESEEQYKKRLDFITNIKDGNYIG